VASFFEPDGVSYFPPGMYEGPFRGADTIGRKWHEAATKGGRASMAESSKSQ